MSLVEVKDLVIQFKTEDALIRAVNGISFNVDAGSSLGLVGETGAGKTTTALGIMGLVPAPPGQIVNGSINFNGKNLLELSEREMRAIRGSEISMIFQDPMTALNPVMTVGDQISEVILQHQKCTKIEAETRMAEMLELVGLSVERAGDYPYQFSGGMKQRIVIAIALACNPKLLLADEPTTALDVTIQAQVLSMINDLKTKFKTAMVLITHDLGIVAESCEYVAIVYAGEVVEYGNLEDIFDRASHPYTKGLFDAIPSLDKEVKRLSPISGLMPDPANLPKGCKFCPRCPSAMAKCEAETPDPTEIAPGHLIRCFIFE
jgi:peptide/nickel transport system ATP-binding protein